MNSQFAEKPKPKPTPQGMVGVEVWGACLRDVNWMQFWELPAPSGLPLQGRFGRIKRKFEYEMIALRLCSIIEVI